MSGSGDRAAWIAEKSRYRHIRVDIVAVGAVCGTLGRLNYLPELLHTQQDQRECLHGARLNGADCVFKSFQNQGFEITIRTVFSSSMQAFPLVLLCVQELRQVVRTLLGTTVDPYNRFMCSDIEDSCFFGPSESSGHTV